MMVENECLSKELIFKAMEMTSKNCFPSNLLRSVSRDQCFIHRSEAVRWMKTVVPGKYHEIRDTSIQIFDNFLISSYQDSPNILRDTASLGFIAVASILLSSKLHSSTLPIKPTTFTHFSTADVIFFEIQVLMRVAPRMSTMTSPAFFAQYIVSLCSDIIDKDQLLQMMNTIIGEFWEDGASLLFAPSTISISSAIVCLSMLRMDCSKLLDSLPDFLLPNRSYPFFLESDGKGLYLDLDSCVKSMERLPSFRAAHLIRSPVTITEVDNL